jgi:hypothetical protein
VNVTPEADALPVQLAFEGVDKRCIALRVRDEQRADLDRCAGALFGGLVQQQRHVLRREVWVVDLRQRDLPVREATAAEEHFGDFPLRFSEGIHSGAAAGTATVFPQNAR